MRDIGVKALTDNKDTPGSLNDLPYARTLSFTETEEYEDLRGDDQLIGSHGAGAIPEWEIESGGIKLDVYKLFAGGATVATGTTPNQKITYTKMAADGRKYVKFEGQAISDAGGDFHPIIYAAKATGDIEGELSDGAFWLTGISGKGFPTNESGVVGRLYDFVDNETAVAIT
jgi:hypothetical protein